ncbi:MAG: hypothetical protein Q9M48_02170 [Rhodobacterales bacterium]|nr:hypothetical protein [Rhodobacterales bacterium]
MRQISRLTTALSCARLSKFTAIAIVSIAVQLSAQPLAAQSGNLVVPPKDPATSNTLGTPQERHPSRLLNFNTAYQLRAGEIEVHVGTHQTTPGYARTGTGNQIYYGGIDWGVTDRIQLRMSRQHFEDPVSRPINGVFYPIRFQSLGVAAKIRLYQGERISIAAEGAIERFVFESDLFGSRGGVDGVNVIGALHLPVTYAASPRLNFHVTPGVSVFPDTINGLPFYGTIASLGAGFSWKPNARWLAYGSVVYPFGPGGNTISSTAAITRVPIWTAGMRYNVSPKIAVDLYATNGIGLTSATSVLSFFPNGDTPLFGARLVYTPGRSAAYRPNYRGFSATPLSARNRSLQQNGFTLTSADTLAAGTFMTTGQSGTFGNLGGGALLSPDHDGQVEAYYEQYAVDGSVGRNRTPNDKSRYMVGGKLRLMDENNGSALSLSVSTLLGRDTGRTGVFYADVATSRKVNTRLALTVNPKLAAYGSTTQFGIGLGANYQLTRDLQAIAEVTPLIHGYTPVWAAGVRYQIPKTSVNIDLHATNAIGAHGLGTLVSQNETKFVFGATMRFGLKWN